jgi:hypothetical protein
MELSCVVTTSLDINSIHVKKRKRYLIPVVFNISSVLVNIMKKRRGVI